MNASSERRQLLTSVLLLGLGGAADAQAPVDSLGPLRERSWIIEPIDTHLTLRVPVFARGQLREFAGGYHWLGNSGRFNLSLISAAPQCQGGSLHAQAADCFQARLRELPGLETGSMSRQDLPGFSLLRYWQQIPWKDRKLRVRHLHLYLARQGQWVDVHASLIEASPTEQGWFDALGDSLQVDGPP